MKAVRLIRYIFIRVSLLVILLLPVAIFLMFRAQGLPADTFVTTPDLQVTESAMYVRFQPTKPMRTAWMLIPGCPADPHAYGALARAMALQGVLSVIVKVPYRCAPLSQHQDALRQRVNSVLDSCPDCAWTLAGHSHGARHALELARALPTGKIASLVLIGSTHPREESFASLGIPVLKILGSEDGVAPLEEAKSTRGLLPGSTRTEVIDGGNHAQFGYYAFQLWDRPARITRETQHERVAGLLLSALTGPKAISK